MSCAYIAPSPEVRKTHEPRQHSTGHPTRWWWLWLWETWRLWEETKLGRAASWSCVSSSHRIWDCRSSTSLAVNYVQPWMLTHPLELSRKRCRRRTPWFLAESNHEVPEEDTLGGYLDDIVRVFQFLVHLWLLKRDHGISLSIISRLPSNIPRRWGMNTTGLSTSSGGMCEAREHDVPKPLETLQSAIRGCDVV